MTHPFTPAVQAQIVESMNALGWGLLGDSWKPILESPVPDEDIDNMLREYGFSVPLISGVLGEPLPPNEPQTCQHLRIDNANFCCVKCREQMIGCWTIATRTVLSAPNINPCTNPEHLRAIAAGEPVDCDAVYVPGPARPVVIGYEPTYRCSRCSSNGHTLIEGEPFVPDCGHSHRGDMIRPGAEQ